VLDGLNLFEALDHCLRDLNVTLVMETVRRAGSHFLEAELLDKSVDAPTVSTIAEKLAYSRDFD